MTLEHLLAFNAALLAAWASPGPAMLVALRATLTGGRAAGIATGAGLAVTAAFWTLLALAGLDGLLRLFPPAYVGLKLLGAAYLMWIAWSTWRAARSGIDPSAMPPRRAVLDGVIVNLGNPKSVLFAAAVIVVIFPPDLSMGDKIVVVANHLLFEVAAYSTLAAAIGTRTVAERYLRAKVWLDRCAAVVLGGLGLRLLFSR